MGRVGSASDSEMVGTFVATLKTELVYRRSWPTRHELEREFFSYLEGFYNFRRRHSRLGNLSPTDSEKQGTDEGVRLTGLTSQLPRVMRWPPFCQSRTCVRQVGQVRQAQELDGNVSRRHPWQ